MLVLAYSLDTNYVHRGPHNSLAARPPCKITETSLINLVKTLGLRVSQGSKQLRVRQ